MEKSWSCVFEFLWEPCLIKNLIMMMMKLFDTLMVFLKEFFKKVDFEKNLHTTKKHEKLPKMQRVKSSCLK